jgi:CTP:phosphocholine cytidylyltransferase-like protein
MERRKIHPSMDMAILLAAGTGMRMRPITLKTPKPLVKVHGLPLIETVIQGLLHVSIKEIYIVVGYLGEQFQYLTKKYPGITLLQNEEYSYKNNISSIFAARDVLGKANTFICEGDLLIKDFSLFEIPVEHSFYMGKWVNGPSHDWSFRLENGRMTKITTGGEDVFNMAGISYWTKEDALAIKEGVLTAYTHPEHESLYWDQVVDTILDKIHVMVYPVTDEQLVEIDTVKELQTIDSSYYSL